MATNCNISNHIDWNYSINSETYQQTYFSYTYCHQTASALAFFFYLFVFVTLCRNSSKLKNTFYVFVFSLGVVDLSDLLILSTGVINYDISRREPFIWVVNFCIQFIWYSNIFNVLGLTLSRLSAIFCYAEGEQRLSKRATTISLTVIYAASTFWSLPILLPSQRLVCLDDNGYAYDWELSRTYRRAEIVFSTLAIIGCTVMYLFMFVKVKRLRNTSGLLRNKLISSNATADRRFLRIKNKEYNILIQSFIITVCLLGLLFGSYSSRFVSSSFVAFVLHTSTALINHGINPFLYVIFSSQIRNLVANSIGCSRVANYSQATSPPVSTVRYRRASAISSTVVTLSVNASNDKDDAVGSLRNFTI